MFSTTENLYFMYHNFVVCEHLTKIINCE